MERIGFPLVRVVWIDAESRDDWENIEGVDRSCKEVITIGHLIEDTNDYMALAMNLDLHNDACSMVMTIPNHWVESVDELQIV